jgi:hypothetical protein
MPITVTCPSCSQLCQVDDQYAGAPVKCPSCGKVMQVNRPEAGAPGIPPSAAPVLPSAAPSGQGLMDTIQQSAASFGLDGLSVKLLYAGIGCLAAMLLFTFFPWLSFSGSVSFGGIQVQGTSVTRLGISIWYGILNFLLCAGVLGFLIVAFIALKKKDVFDISLWVAGGWSALAVLWRLIDVINAGSVTGIGLILTLLASLGAAGTFGFIIYQRFIKSKMNA